MCELNADTRTPEERFRMAREKHIAWCRAHGFIPQFSHDRPLITRDMRLVMDCPFPPGDDL